MITLLLHFPGEELFTDVSALVRPYSYVQNNRLFNDSCESVIDTASVDLAYDRLLAARIMDVPSDQKILCEVFQKDGMALFTGYVAPVLALRKGRSVQDISLDIRDHSFKLDVPLADDFQMPASMSSPAVTVRSLYEAIITAAGYDASYILSDGMGVTETIRMVSVEKGQYTYRQMLDSILRDHGYVFTMTEHGKFSLYRWNSGQYLPEGIVDRNLSVVDAFEVVKQDESHDGVKLTWSSLEVLDPVRLYGANLPIGEDQASSGVTILPGRYYPDDGDIIPTFQKYQSEWLDEPYQSRKSRIRNKDITLVTSEHHRLVANHDEGIVIQVEEYGKHQGRILFHNPTLEAKKLYVFELYGSALFRSSIQETLVPPDAADVREETSEHVYTAEAAQRLATGLYRLYQFGNFEYRFTLREKLYDPGQVVTIRQDDPALDTNVLISELSWTDGRDAYRYKARGVSVFADVESVTVSYRSAKSGKGERGEKGEDATHVQVISDQGTTFRMGQGFSTTLEARVFQGGADVTEAYLDGDFRWYRTSSDTHADDIWNSAHYSTGGKVLTITQDDVAGRSNFFCNLLTKRS